MSICTFCGKEIEKGTGKMFVYANGKIAYFCSRTCEKNLHKLKRKPLRTPWTAEYRREHKKGQSSPQRRESEKKVSEPEKTVQKAGEVLSGGL